MASYYAALSEKFKWPVDTQLLGKLKSNIAEKVAEFDAKLVEATEQLGESEVRDLMEARADYLCLAGEKVRLRVRRARAGGVGGQAEQRSARPGSAVVSGPCGRASVVSVYVWGLMSAASRAAVVGPCVVGVPRDGGEDRGSRWQD